MATYETKGRLTYKDENSDNHIIYPVTKMDCIEDMPDIETEIAESVAAYLEDNPVETPDITDQVSRAETAASAAEAAKESASASANNAGGYASVANTHAKNAQTYASSASSSATRAEEAAIRAEEAVASIPESGGGTVKTVNGVVPDENGNVEITIPDSGGNEAIEKVDRKVDTLREVVSKSNIVESASGDLITVSDASDIELAGLRIFGKTSQNGTPTPEVPVPLDSVGDDGSVAVTVCGKNLYDASTILSSVPASTFIEINNDKYRIYGTKETAWASSKSKVITLSAGVTYTLSGTVDSIVSGVPRIALRNVESKILASASPTTPGRYNCKYTPTEDIDVYVSLFATGSTPEIGDVTYSDIQLEVGSTATDYEPYKDGGSLIVSTPNGLPGIPVDSGGNYTDDSGQQWVCDEVDFEKGQYIQRIYCYTFTGQETINSFDSGKTLGRDIKLLGLPSCIVPKKDSGSNVSPMLCTHEAVTTQNALKNDSGGIAVAMWGNTQYLYFSGTSYGSVDVLKTAMAEAYASGTPYVWMYALETPIETALSAEQLAEYANAALHTNYPSTTVFNDGGAGMEVAYVADTKLYVDKKFAELSAALLNQ